MICTVSGQHLKFQAAKNKIKKKEELTSKKCSNNINLERPIFWESHAVDQISLAHAKMVPCCLIGETPTANTVNCVGIQNVGRQ